jgi:hypothetical protein
MLFKKGWGSTYFKRCFIIYSYRPYTSFLVGLVASHVGGPSGLRFVAGFGGVARKTCVRLTDLLAMIPTAIA